MARPVTGTIKTSTVRVKRKNGDIYVLERKSVYDAEKGYTKSLGTHLIGKIPVGQTEVVATRPRKNKIEASDLGTQQPVIERKRLGLKQILDWIGTESGIDSDIARAADKGDAQKALTVARYLFASEGQSIPHIEKWQITHEAPYSDGLSESSCSRLFESLGKDEATIQKYFKNRAQRLDSSPSIAYDSTTVSSYSKNLIDARQGFNKAADGLDTVKLLTLYSVDSHQPIAFTKQPGNLPDVTSVKNALKQLDFLSLKQPLVVTDNGYYSQSNLTDFTRNNVKFLTLANTDITWIHNELEAHREELERMSSICPWDRSVHGITVATEHEIQWVRQRTRADIKSGETQKQMHRYYLHFFLNRENVARDERRQVDALLELRDQILCGAELTDTAQRKAQKFLTESRSGRGGVLRVDFNEKAIAEARKDYGYFVLVSNKPMDPFEALRTYRLREKIEECFRIQKDRLDGTRTRVWYSDNLRGRFFVQFLALGYYCFLLHRINEMKATLGKQTGDEKHDKKEILQQELKLKAWLEQRSIGQILDWFDCIEETCIKTPSGSLRWSTESTERDRLFFLKLGIA